LNRSLLEFGAVDFFRSGKNAIAIEKFAVRQPGTNVTILNMIFSPKNVFNPQKIIALVKKTQFFRRKLEKGVAPDTDPFSFQKVRRATNDRNLSSDVKKLLSETHPFNKMATIGNVS
jgi:hypothetical protein